MQLICISYLLELVNCLYWLFAGIRYVLELAIRKVCNRIDDMFLSPCILIYL